MPAFDVIELGLILLWLWRLTWSSFMTQCLSIEKSLGFAPVTLALRLRGHHQKTECIKVSLWRKLSMSLDLMPTNISANCQRDTTPHQHCHANFDCNCAICFQIYRWMMNLACLQSQLLILKSSSNLFMASMDRKPNPEMHHLSGQTLAY